MKKPENVIGGYISGVRKQYVNPVSFFGLTLTIVSIEWIILQKFFPELLNMSSISPNGDETFFNNISSIMEKYGSLLMMLYVPLYAIISRTVFFDSKTYNYTEHVVAYLYILSVISLFGAITNLIFVSFDYDLGGASYISIIIQVVYISFCFKRLYKLSTEVIIGRAFLSFVIYMILYLIIATILLTIIYFIDGKEAIIDIIKGFMPQR